MARGLRSRDGVGAPPFTKGPYEWDQYMTFAAGVGGIGFNVFNGKNIWYVDKTNNAATGDGKSWPHAFLTITEATTAAGDYDIILVGPGFYTEAAEIVIDQVGLKIIGCNSSGKTRGPCSFKTPTAAGPMLTIAVDANDVEIAGISFIATSGHEAIVLGGGAAGYVWRTHIHDCAFFGDDTGTYAVGVFGATINPSAGAFPDCAEAVVENCCFYAWATAALCLYGTRTMTKNNTIFVPDSGIGIVLGNGRPFGQILYNRILGVNSSDTGIAITGNDDTATIVHENMVIGTSVLITQDVGDGGIASTNYNYGNGTTVVVIDPTST